MRFSLLTYNLLYNKAASDVHVVLQRYKPDIVCFQEIVTDDTTFASIERLGYRLADYSNFMIRFGKIFGVATFYNPKVFSFHASASFNLPRAFFEMLLYLFQIRVDPRIVLKTQFTSKEDKKTLCVYNIHLTPFATNTLRAKQINNFLPDLDTDKGMPVVIAGDFNYPYRRKTLEALFAEYDLKEATSSVMTTFEKKIFRFLSLSYKTDYILYRNLKSLSAKKLMYYFSDHFPILSKFEL